MFWSGPLRAKHIGRGSRITSHHAEHSAWREASSWYSGLVPFLNLSVSKYVLLGKSVLQQAGLLLQCFLQPHRKHCCCSFNQSQQFSKCSIFHLLREWIIISQLFLLVSIIYIQPLRNWKHGHNATFWGIGKLELPRLKIIPLFVIWKTVPATTSSHRNKRSAFYWLSMLPWNIACFGFFTGWQYFLSGLDIKITEGGMEMSHLINLMMLVVYYVVKNAFRKQSLVKISDVYTQTGKSLCPSVPALPTI